MNWGSIGRGFASVADDAARAMIGSRIGSQMMDDAVKYVTNFRLSADDAARIMAQAQDEAVKFMDSYAVKSMPGVDDNAMMYEIGRGAANTGQFIKNNAGTALNTGMTAMYVAPMMMSILPQQEYKEQMYG